MRRIWQEKKGVRECPGEGKIGKEHAGDKAMEPGVVDEAGEGRRKDRAG